MSLNNALLWLYVVTKLSLVYIGIMFRKYKKQHTYIVFLYDPEYWEFQNKTMCIYNALL